MEKSFPHYAAYIIIRKSSIIRIDDINFQTGDVKITIIYGNVDQSDISESMSVLMSTGELFEPMVFTDDDKAKYRAHKRKSKKSKLTRGKIDQCIDIEKLKSKERHKAS